jgi:hypothetical protein
MFMRLTLAITLIFCFLAWDLGRNNGHYTNHFNAYLDDLGRMVR